jgi:tetratricopeptide (TPR) repeat protein
MQSINDIVSDIRQAVEVISDHPADLRAQQALERAVNAAERALEQLATRFQQTRSLQDINQIIACTDHVLSVVPRTHKSRVTLLSDLHVALNQRFSMMGPDGKPEDMDRAVRLAEDVVSATQPGTDQRTVALSNLNTTLRARYDQTRDVQYIKRAITAAEQAVGVIPKGSPYTAAFLDTLAVSLGKLFEHTHDLDVAERALATAESAVKTAAKRGAVQGVALGSNTLARILGRRFERTGMIVDLDRAVSVLTDTVPMILKDTKNYVVGLGYLATLLGIRFEHQGDVADLDASIRYMKNVLQLTPNNDSDRLVQLYNQANRLAERAQYTGAISDLDAAIAYGQQVLNFAPKNHPERANWLRGLSQFFGMRFVMGKRSDDIREAISLSKQAAEAVDADDILMRAALACFVESIRGKVQTGWRGCRLGRGHRCPWTGSRRGSPINSS